MELYEKNGNILYILNVLKKYSDEAHMLSATEIQRKVNLVGDIMANSHNMSMPFEYAKESGKFVRIPRVLYDSIMETSRFSQCVRANLEEESYGTNW